jgi:deoxyribose-phosphate aldolase
VIAFHEGTAPTASKVVEALAAVAAGAKELDMVLNRKVLLGTPSEPSYMATFAELKAIRDAVPVSKGVHLKLILETSALPTKQDVAAACVLAGAAGWDYVKTSTGFCGRGASVEDVQLMSACAKTIPAVLGNEEIMKVKASGGIRTFEDAEKMIEAGASRIGASSGMAIMEEAKG